MVKKHDVLNIIELKKTMTNYKHILTVVIFIKQIFETIKKKEKR